MRPRNLGRLLQNVVDFTQKFCPRSWAHLELCKLEKVPLKVLMIGNRIIRQNLERLVAAKASLEVRCLVVPGCTDGEDLAARHRYLGSLGLGENQVVDLEYFDYARSKYQALGLKDTMPPKTGGRFI